MCKVLMVLLLAGALVLVLSVSVSAGAENSNKWFGQLHQSANWGFEMGEEYTLPGDTPPGHRVEIPGGPEGIEGNPGESISQMVHLINAEVDMWAIFDNWGKFTSMGLVPEK